MKRNATLWYLSEMDRVETMVMKRRLRWLGHIERTENSRLPKCFLVCRLRLVILGGGQLKARRRDGVMCWQVI